MKKSDVLEHVIGLSKHFDVISFDIFDTIIRRETLNLSQIHHLSSSWVLPQVCSDATDRWDRVLFYRQHICNILRDSVALGSREPVLDAILERLVLSARPTRPLNDARAIARRAVEFELALESSTLKAHPDAVQVIARLQAMGKRVVALSDMYFSKPDLEALLTGAGLGGCFEQVFLSSDIGRTKHEGDVFPMVAKALGVQPGRILHVGDNPDSDGVRARASGWGSLLLNGHFPTLASKPEPTGQELLVDIASDIMASFVMSTLLSAHEKGIGQVFFLSRDAVVFQRIWERVRQGNPALAEIFRDIETSELCVSRLSTNWLSLLWSRGFAAEVAGRLTWLNGSDLTYPALLGHFGLPVPPTAGRTDRVESVEKLAERLERDGLVEPLRAAVLARQSLAFRYLVQQGVVGRGDVLLADIGYSGTVALYLNNYLLREAPEQIGSTHLHVKMVASNSYVDQNRTFAAQSATIYSGVVFVRDHLPTILADNFSWLEAMFKDVTRGALTGYREVDGRIEPVFAPAPAGLSPEPWLRFEDAAVAKLCRGLESLAYATPQVIDQIRDRAIARFHEPEPAFIKAVAELSQETNAIGSDMHGIVEAVTPTKVLARLRSWKVNDYWISGCLVASGQGRLIRHYDTIKRGHTGLRRIGALPVQALAIARRVAGRVRRR